MSSPRGRACSGAPTAFPGGRAPTNEPDAKRQRMSALLPLVKSKAMTEAEFIRQAGVPRAVARQFIKNDGALMRKGPPPFLTTEEEELLVRFIRSNAHIGRGMTRVDIRGVVGEYIDCLSAAR